MDFDDSPEEQAYRAEVRSFLDANAAPKTDSSLADSYYAKAPGAGEESQHVKLCKQWQHLLYDNGWAGIAWPKAYGGRGETARHQGIFNQEQARYDVHAGIFSVGIGMTGPTLIAHGTEEQKQRYLRPMLAGDDVWCQLFSEPGAGSDLGGLRTTAVRDGDEWVVNGQKVWNSGAQYSDWGILLTRSDPDVPKHRGITYFVVDMGSAGVDVRPLRQITGAAHFNEVFLTDVRIPHDNIIGQVNAGWGPMMTTLANERTLIGSSQSMVTFDDIVAFARNQGVAGDPTIRQELIRQLSYAETIKYLGYRTQTAASRGKMPGPESSVIKLAASRRLEHQGNLVMSIAGASGMLWEKSAHLGGFWQNQFLGQWMSRIGGGTDQIQRNTIGEKVLQLPPEPRVDKGIPFKDVPK
ncbi:MAG: acyl-CoA dehydrogenase family protein [Acidimicrobiales bacterium]